MSQLALTLSLLAATLAGCATVPEPRPLIVAPSPVTFDGDVAGKASDIVFTLVADPSPESPGIALKTGESLQLGLPAAFKRNPAVAINVDADTNVVLTKGWPQGAVRLVGQYRIRYDDGSNAMILTATQDVPVDGANAPGIKAIHLRGRSFINPMPGTYVASVTQSSPDGTPLARWEGPVSVLEAAPLARLAPTNFHLPPGVNGDFQKVALGQVAPVALGLLLWGAQSVELNDVGIAPRDMARFPRYTGGLLVQDTNHDGKLDPGTDQVVGGIIGAAPQGAAGQMATSQTDANGALLLSGRTPKNSAYSAAAGGGQPVPGLLTIQFKTGSLPGLYRPTVELIGGNSYRFTIEAVTP